MSYSQTSKNDFFSSGQFGNYSMMVNYRFDFLQLVETCFVPRYLPFVKDAFVDKRLKSVKRYFKIGLI